MRFRTEEWRQAYAHRIDQILEALRGAGLRVLWCGNPIARSGTYSADMEYLNEIYAEETARYGALFLPLWTAVADDQGRYMAYGKDRDGVTQRLRNDDGIHFTVGRLRADRRQDYRRPAGPVGSRAPPEDGPGPDPCDARSIAD